MKVFLFAVLAFLFLAGAGDVSAMTLHDFGRMNNDDEASFVTALVEGASKHLKEQGHPDLADKTIALFHEPGQNGGVYQFASNMKSIYGLNNLHATNPNNRASELDVEDAMERTLKDNGILVPAAYLRTIGKGFHPVGPPRGYATGT